MGKKKKYIKLALFIYFTYGNGQISMLFSQIIHPLLLPPSPKVCSLQSVSFAALNVGRWQVGSRCRGYMYTEGQFILMYGKNHHNVVK